MILIPVRSDLDYYTMVITLEGVDFGLTFIWNGALERWTFSIYDAEALPIVEGVDVIYGWFVLGRFKDTRLPAGDIFFANLDGSEVDPGRDNFGINALMFYKESTE